MKKGIKIAFALVGIGLVSFILVSIFLKADLRTQEIKNNTQSAADIQKAKNLLTAAVQKQGLDKINQYSTYEAIGTDHWKGLMGKMGNPWGWGKDLLALRFSVGDFDSQVEVLEGEKKGFVAGVQSFDYYEKGTMGYDSDAPDDFGKTFTLTAFHYFFELGNRLSSVPFIRYAGTGEIDGKQMEKVFASWGNGRTQAYDQYIVWIGKESGLIEATTFTTRDNPIPAPAFMYGSMRFDDFVDIGGILIPFTQTAHIGNPQNSTEAYVHQVTLQSFTWDKFPIDQIRPFEELEPMGDEKPAP